MFPEQGLEIIKKIYSTEIFLMYFYVTLLEAW